ncbi:MAG: hypothetical protein P4L77_11690 [Sulfuriferula sp.]|nr:hypothetical protein [Sulfuriferula sp.]
MKARQGFVLAMLVLCTSAQAQSKTEVIQDALKRGAIIVKCHGGVCRNDLTQEVVGKSNVEGSILTYPDGPEFKAEEERTALLLARAK